MASGAMRSRQVTKRCHWVPQAYLRDFAADEARKKIWRFSKKAGDREIKPIEKVAMRHHLYIPRDSKTGMREDSFEQKLSELERWFADPVWKALQTDFVNLDWSELRKLIFLVISVMYLRTPLHYEYVRNFHRRMVATVGELGQIPRSFLVAGKKIEVDPESWPNYRDASEDDLKRLWISQISGATEYAEMLICMRWSMIVSDTPTFITSDNPVVVIHPSLKFKGLSDPATIVFFPISPRRILVMDHAHNQPANQYYPLQGNGAAENLLIWRNAIEYMFSHQDTDEVCRLMLAEAEAPLKSCSRRCPPNMKHKDKPPLIWPALLELPAAGQLIVYLDLNHWIGLSQALGNLCTSLLSDRAGL